MSSKNNRPESSALPLDDFAANDYVQESLFDVGPDAELMILLRSPSSPTAPRFMSAARTTKSSTFLPVDRACLASLSQAS